VKMYLTMGNVGDGGTESGGIVQRRRKRALTYFVGGKGERGGSNLSYNSM